VSYYRERKHQGRWWLCRIPSERGLPERVPHITGFTRHFLKTWTRLSLSTPHCSTASRRSRRCAPAQQKGAPHNDRAVNHNIWPSCHVAVTYITA